MKYIATVSLLIAFLACSTAKTVTVLDEQSTAQQDSANTSPFNTFITLSHYHPYCGGMAPTKEILARQRSVQSNTTFLFINLDTQQKERLKTDSTGVLKLNLKAGKYAIREQYKDCSFEDFYKNNFREPSTYYLDQGGKDCYKNWWLANLGEFEITDTDSTYHFSFQSADRCFTGNNPCLMYIGPMPP